MNAEFIARELHGRRCGCGYMARCPAHDDRNPSLSIREGENGIILVKCFSGCDQNLIIECLRSRGLWPTSNTFNRRKYPRFKEVRRRFLSASNPNFILARKIWEETLPADGTLVEVYLRSRGLNLPPPKSIRFHPQLKHQPSDKNYPAMVANVTDVNGCPLGIHRTYLKTDGKGKAAVSPAKMMLGPTAGGTVQLFEPEKFLLVGEGIETSLTGTLATGLPSWAALSTSGLKVLELPPRVSDITILVDLDDGGVGSEAAHSACNRWRSQGRRVRLAKPNPGMDFNQML